MSSSLRRRRLFGLDFVDAPDVGHIVDELLAPPVVEAPRQAVVVTPNVDHLVRRRRGLPPAAAGVIEHAQWVLPDGQPIVAVSRWLGAPLSARLPGSTLVAALWPRLLTDGRPVMVIASSAAIAERITAEAPSATVVVAPMLAASEPEGIEAFADACIAAHGDDPPDYVFVTLGLVKQELVIDALLRHWSAGGGHAPVMLAIGASFEMYYGLKARAPRWVQRAGLEWAFRFVQEPRRLFRRYFIDDVEFIWLVREERRARQGSARPRDEAAHPAQDPPRQHPGGE